MKKIIALILIVSLSGCAGSSIPVTREVVDEAGNVISTTTEYVKDASMAKEETIHQTLRNRDRMINASNAKPSFTMTWQTVEETISIPGQPTITMKRSMPVVTYTEKMQYTQILPTTPSNHPMWTAITTLGGAIIQASLIGYTIHEVSNAYDRLVDSNKGTTNLNADSITLNDSLNDTQLTNIGDGTLTFSPGTAPAAEPIIISTGQSVLIPVTP